MRLSSAFVRSSSSFSGLTFSWYELSGTRVFNAAVRSPPRIGTPFTRATTAPSGGDDRRELCDGTGVSCAITDTLRTRCIKPTS